MTALRKPPWLKKKIVFGQRRQTAAILDGLGLHTVCREAMCPNISECFHAGQATFLILGRRCTRSCRFCRVEKTTPEPPDCDEPRRVAEAVRQLGLKHVVITSVTRDDLNDGGSSLFARTIFEIKKYGIPPNGPTVEVLIPDFQGDERCLETVVAAKPDILGHNLETVPRLYRLRPGADYQRSLALIKKTKEFGPALTTKSGLMLGLGETEAEVIDVLRDLRAAGCDLLALGQYLRPSLQHAEIVAYITPAQFDAYKSVALSLGFAHVESGPYVRTSYHAAEYLTR